jgi:hypothetical protein
MSDRRSDPPGAVSEQNMEEAESGLRGDQRHPEPRTGGADEGRPRGRGTEGESKEGSQSTGHPDNAG